MFDCSKLLNNEDIKSELKDILHLSKIGFEKETLRVSGTQISQSDHPKKLGSSLCNKYITTDFSEAQLEIITPPLSDKEASLIFLENIHHFVSNNLDNEMLWPFSIPPPFKKDEEILIAKYGRSNLGQLKEVYRIGLSHRYGRAMQAISGFHYNYSLPVEIWSSSLFKNTSLEIRSSMYFNMLRNIYRINWLILYLFGSSPILTKNFVNKEERKNFSRIDDQTYFLPYATSLRMSDLGYQNLSRVNIDPSLNKLSDYIADLRSATNTHSNEFAKINKNDQLRQLSPNILQIDEEYYAVARPKNNKPSDKRTTDKLTQEGVNYIELRSLDLNPFSRVGIDPETLNFLEVFMIYCFLSPSKRMSSNELNIIKNNDLLVSRRGREPGLKLIKDQESITLKEWGKLILDGMISVAELLNNNDYEYTAAIDSFKNKIEDSSQTLSALFLKKIQTDQISFIDLGTSIAKKNKIYYSKLMKDRNIHFDLLSKEANDSLKEKLQIENNDSQSFEDYLNNYFAK